MEVPLPYDPLPNGYEEWWNEFSIEPELIYLSQIPFEALMASTEPSEYRSYQFSTEELEQENSYCTSEEESPSVIIESPPVTPEPAAVLRFSRDLQVDEEFHSAEVQHKLYEVSRLAKALNSPSSTNDLVVVLTRQFCNTSNGGTEFTLAPSNSLIETHTATLDEATKQEIKNRLAQRKPITKPQPLPDAALHEELMNILQEHNILQKSLARTLGISQSALSSYFNKKPKINGWKSLERQLFRWKAEFLAKKSQMC